MERQRWKEIEAIYQAAVDKAEDQRRAYLDQVCADDADLRSEVEALLAVHESQGADLEVPALEQVAQAYRKVSASLAGRRLGPCEVLSLLGKGGMGEVYLARDTRLDRQVALKVLPLEVTEDPERLKRFVREAKAASALDHPNIATIHELGEAEGVHYIVMEYVKGETLSSRIAAGADPRVRPWVGAHGGAPLQIETILDIGIQVADALDEAHHQGITHRDIKPANLMLTPRGQVKVLDFGLAKRMHQPAPSTGTAASTESQTTPGLIMGTVDYMSPEQVLGQEVDHRTDLFSLGVVLYQMATGTLPFKGETSGALFNAILNQTPPSPVRLNPDLPARLGEIIDKALEKDREVRYQVASEIRADLKRLKRDTDSGRPTMTEGQGKTTEQRWLAKKWKWALAGMALMLLIGIGVIWFAKRRVQPQPMQEFKETRLTANPSELGVGFGSISPEGKYLAYSDRRGLYLKLIETGEVRTIPQPEGSTGENARWYPNPWFPDGTKFLAQRVDATGSNSTWVISVLGGPPHLLRTNADPGPPSPDRSQIVYLTGTRAGGALASELCLMGAQGENPRKFWTAPKGEWLSWPVWSPDGQRIAYVRDHGGQATIESRNPKGEQLTTVLSDPRFTAFGLWWFPNGRMVFTAGEPRPNQNDSSLWEIQVDPNNGRPLGPPRRITRWRGLDVMVLNGTTDGKRLAVLRTSRTGDVYVGEWEAKGHRLKNARRLTQDERNDFPSAWTRDSKAVLFHSDRNGQLDIFKQALDQDIAEPVATGTGNKHDPVLSQDGSWILYLQDVAEGSTRVMRVPSSGGAPEMVLEGKGINGLKCPWSPAVSCVLGEESPDRKQYIFTEFDPMKGRRRELSRVTLKPPVEDYFWDLTRDSSRLAFAQGLRGSETRIQILPLSDGETREVVIQSEIQMSSLDWAIDGRGFYVGSGDGVLLFVDMDGHTEVLWKRETLWGLGPRGLPSPDGLHLAMLGWTIDSNVWMLENF